MFQDLNPYSSLEIYSFEIPTSSGVGDFRIDYSLWWENVIYSKQYNDTTIEENNTPLWVNLTLSKQIGWDIDMQFHELKKITWYEASLNYWTNSEEWEVSVTNDRLKSGRSEGGNNYAKPSDPMSSNVYNRDTPHDLWNNLSLLSSDYVTWMRETFVFPPKGSQTVDRSDIKSTITLEFDNITKVLTRYDTSQFRTWKPDGFYQMRELLHKEAKSSPKGLNWYIVTPIILAISYFVFKQVRTQIRKDTV